MERKILLYGHFGKPWWSDEGITATDFLNELEEANKDAECDSILVCINSPGGSTFEGTAIYNHIIDQNKTEGAKPINTRNDGIAYSMGAIVLMAGIKPKAFRNSTTLLHCCSGSTWGNVRDHQASISLMMAVDQGITESISAKSGRTVDDVKENIMNYDDHVYTAQEAKDAKIIDEIIDRDSEKAKDYEGLSYEEVMAKFAENGLKAKMEKGEMSFFQRLGNFFNQNPNPQPKKESKTSNTKEDEPMKIHKNLTALLAVFGLSAVEGKDEQEHNPTAEQLEAVNAQLEEAKTLKDQVAEKDTTISTRDQKIQELEAKVKELEDGSSAKPNSGANGDATEDGGETESFESSADAELKAMRESMGIEEPKNED